MTLTTFKQLFRNYQESGLNVKDFCFNQGIAPSSFYYWRKKLVDNNKDNQPKHFVPLVFDPYVSDNRVSTNRVDSKASNNGSSLASIEFVFPNGTKMILREAVDMAMVKTIIHLFD